MVLWFVIGVQVLLTVRGQPLLQGSCSFEQSTCGYSSDPAYEKWTINEEGRFIAVDSGRAVLVSPDLELLDWSCLRLVYQITGSGSVSLHLRPEDENFDYALWSSSTPSDSWVIASVDLRNTSTSYKVLMEGRPGKGEGKSVAIFEIHIVPGYCIDCNFEEHHLCGYSNQWNPNVNWYVGGSIARDPQSNLPDDHTMNNERGHYMYVNSVYAKKFQEVAKLSSPMTTTPMAGCLTFYYQRDQERGNIFSVYTKDQLGHYEEIWRPEVYATSHWKLVQVDIKAPHPLEVVFEVAFNSPRGGYVALDDISFSRSSVTRRQSRLLTRPSPAATLRRGFAGDHTTGTGFFLLANTRFTSRPGYVGRLHGPVLPENLRYCLRFHYALHGFRKVDNALAVYVYDDHNVAQEKVWSLSDASRDVWIEVDITFQKPMPTKVVFVSICKNFWDCGLVALDDIIVSLGDCRVTAGMARSLPGQCDFEFGNCGYTQDKKGDMGDWVRMRGHTPTSYTGPKGDHTTGVGYFMYTEASHMLPGHSARLLSAELRGSAVPQCLLFYYHMRRGEQSVSWMLGAVDYTCEDRHQIVFEAIRGPSIRSDIAVDDIVFKKGPCTDPGDSIPYSGFSENFNEIDY
ncbi:hypothetical protein ANANG_G00197510 [Anguilla anguilla]|uniref:MAM domain-containing protein n=1 Tax=Anguilla anguilla TaxID=7936 RepID=A0A9D3M273_ANGAN|nr:hypothetical protein ANANG_G00197510 [Anguilla anguilla]